MHAARLENLTRKFGPVTALDGVDLDVHQGEVLALLGPNGAGKTTAVHLMMGLLRPSAGRVTVFGGDPTRRANRQRCGVMLQVGGLPPTLTVGEHLRLFASYYPAPLDAVRALEAAGLEGLANRRVDRLSGGQRQRLMFALALIGNPELLFLDEPTVGLDVQARRRFWQTIRELAGRGRTILLTTHYLEEADALADRIAVLDHGRVLIDGNPDQVKARAAGHRVSCRTATPVATVGEWPGVHRVEPDGERLSILCAQPEPVVRRLLNTDPGLSELEVSRAGLEEAFLALTNHATEHEEAA